jgi:hypothetical protein
VRPDRLERALAQAERLQLHDHRASPTLIARSNGHRRTGALARATAQEPKLTRSELEAMFLALVHEAGLPEPDVNSSLDAPDHPASSRTSTGRRTASWSRTAGGGRSTAAGHPHMVSDIV